MFAVKLNREQRRAVETIEGPVMVLAGPGTGKTQVLTMRIANILQATQMDPWNILCLTFTESAVAAMRARLLAIIGPAAYQVRIHTFHSFCNEVMQEYPDKFSAARDWQVLSDVERIDTLIKIIDDFPGGNALKPFGNPYLYLPDIISNIQALKQENIDPKSFTKTLKNIADFTATNHKAMEEFCALSVRERTDSACEEIYTIVKDRPPAPNFASQSTSQGRTKFKNDLKRWFDQLTSQLPKQQALARVYRAYQKALQQKGRYDYEDMISMVVARLKTDDELLARYQEQFQYMLVDEYQDSNGAQNEVVRLLGSWDDQPNIFVVGDDKQSIYRFQGASLTNMLSFYEAYKKHNTVISLKENYRSTQVILDAAQAVITHNRESITKYIADTGVRLKAVANKSKASLAVHSFSSEEAEDSWVAQQCQDLIKQGVEPSAIAVLYRVNQDGVELLNMMRRLQVPARLEIGENVLNDRRVGQWLSLLGYLNNIHRDDLLAEMLHYPWWNIDSLDVLRVIHYTGKQKKSLLPVIMSADELKKAGVNNAQTFLHLTKLLADWRAAATGTTLTNFLDTVLTQSGWLDYALHHNGDAEAVHRLNVLLNEAKLLNQGSPHLSLADFMRHLKILREHNLPLTAAPWQAHATAVHLMTAHRAKGQEFIHVFITRLTDKHWGNRREWNKVPLPQGLVRQDFIVGQANNEDERRLFYVALTRARQQLYLTYSTHNLAGREQIPSVFLAELPHKGVRYLDVDVRVPDTLTSLRAPLPVYSSAGVKGWLQQLLTSYIMSVTHLNNYLECPRLFYFRNLLRVPEAPTAHQAFGSAVHRALRDWLESSVGTLHATSLLDRFEHHLKREILTPAQIKESLAQGTRVLTAYAAMHQEKPSVATKLEYDFSSHGVQLDGIPLTGKVDKIEIIDADKKLVNIVDYKTGNPDSAWAYVKPGGKYHRQLVFYKLLTELSPRFDYNMISGEIDFIQPSHRTGKHVTKKIEVTKADLDELRTTIKKSWEEIQALKFLEEDSGCGECQYCRAV